jgi:molybdopterin-binding protein
VLLKATSIMLRLARGGAQACDPKPNQMTATVAQVKRGDGQLEVIARLAGERTITAVVARSEATAALARGARVIVSFGPEQVMLVRVA